MSSSHLAISDNNTSKDTDPYQPPHVGERSGSYSLPVSRLLELPNELLMEVTKVLEGDNQTLAAMMKSCKRLKALTDGLLYKDIRIGRSQDHKAAYLVRTLLYQSAYAIQVRKISLELTLLEGFDQAPSSPVLQTISIIGQLRCASKMMLHFEALNDNNTNSNNQYLDTWAEGVMSGLTMNIAAMLLTMVPNVIDVAIRMYQCKGVASHMIPPSTIIFGVPMMDTFITHLRPLFISHLGNVKRLTVLSAGIDMLNLPWASLEVLEVDLIEEYAHPNEPRATSFRNSARNIGRKVPKQDNIHTLRIHSDWSELLPNLYSEPGCVHNLLHSINAPNLLNIEFYTIRSPRQAGTELLCFSNITDGFEDLVDHVQSVRIDFTESPVCDPRAWLGDCSPSLTLTTFPNVRSLAVLQQVIISSNYSRLYRFTNDLQAFLPALLESLTIICPTHLILHWLEYFLEQHVYGLVANLFEVVLLCRCSYGDAPSAFEGDHAQRIFSDLSSLGISVRVEEEVPGSFERKARKEGSVWEADWAGYGWADAMFGVEEF
jgi:hypothetical protein